MSRNKTIDFLRGVGVMLVLLHHIFGRQSIGYEMPVLHIISELFENGGWVGVDLFFVLSGFLVSGLIFKEHTKYGSFYSGRFLIRRGFKIYPLYYLLIAGEIVWWLCFGGLVSIKDIMGQSFFVMNYYYDYQPFTHLWSLSVEEHFYFFLAGFLFLLIKYNKLYFKPILYTYVVFFVFGVLCRLYNYYTFSDWDFLRDYSKSHFRFDALFFGVVLSYIYHYKREYFSKFQRVQTPAFVLTIILASYAFILSRVYNRSIMVWGLAINPLLYGYMLIYLINRPKFGDHKAILPLAYIGKYSYGVYLMHVPAIIVTQAYCKSFTGYYVVSLCLSIFSGIILSKVVEYPFLNLRDKYFPGRSGAPIMS